MSRRTRANGASIRHPSDVTLLALYGVASARGKQLCRVGMINLFQSLIAKPESIQAPVVVELLDFVEMLVQRLKDSERDTVHRLIKTHIGPIDESFGILFIKLRSEARDGRRLSVTCRNVSIQIRIAFEQRAQARQIVVQVGEVAGDERGPSVSRECAVKNVDHAGEGH